MHFLKGIIVVVLAMFYITTAQWQSHHATRLRHTTHLGRSDPRDENLHLNTETAFPLDRFKRGICDNCSKCYNKGCKYCYCGNCFSCP
jgi:hypothetical protein